MLQQASSSTNSVFKVKVELSREIENLFYYPKYFLSEGTWGVSSVFSKHLLWVVCLVEVSRISPEKEKLDYLCLLQDLWRELYPVPSCKHSCSAVLLQIPLPHHVLEASLTVAVSLCHVFGVSSVVVIVMAADELCFVSSGGSLLFSSNMPEFILQCFKSWDCCNFCNVLLSFFTLYIPFLWFQQGLCYGS